jgi:hypothetical protein
MLVGARGQEAVLPVAIRASLDRITAESLRGHLSFLASDALEGRDTPSRGLDIAAEYIAAQYRRAGLEPVGGDGYFQVARWTLEETDRSGFEFRLTHGAEHWSVGADRVSLAFSGPIALASAMIVKAEASKLDELKPEETAGAAILVAIPDPGAVDASERASTIRARQSALEKLSALKAGLVISLDRSVETGSSFGTSRLIDPERPGGMPRFRAPGPPRVTIHDARACEMLEKLPDGVTGARLDFALGAPTQREVELRNVAGILRGSDPELRETCVILSAHYDHIGIGSPVDGDRIHNGANDDGSGTVSVVEIAQALAAAPERPKRSILFITFFGEEKGLLGSRYYGRHPIFPIAKTVAQLNLEQIGRTDDTEGPRVRGASMTGFDYSTVGEVVARAGQAVGIRLEKHARNSDSFFGRSDNQALADLGVPAHTICTAFIFPDYHKLGDHWEKIDYENMAAVDRMIALGVWNLANDPEAPKWNEDHPRAARYAKARKQAD